MIRKAEGNGLSSCLMCNRSGIWNRHWTSMLYTVDGCEGFYCYDCAKKLEDIFEKEQEHREKNSKYRRPSGIS